MKNKILCVLAFEMCAFSQSFKLPSFGFSPNSQQLGSSSSNPVIADFNGDGNLDIAFGAITGGVNVALGNGDGTFSTPILSRTDAGPFILMMTAGDVDGNGTLDLVTYNRGGQQSSPSFSILLGKGDGTFTQSAVYPAPQNFRPGSPILADFDGDGRLDLAFVDIPQSTVDVMLGNGDGTFHNQTSYSTGPGGVCFALAGDFNRDGKQDLIAISCVEPGAMITFLAGRGDGSFADPVSYPAGLPLNSTITSLNSADLNGDGYLDLVATSGGVAVYLGNGDGTFAQPVLYNDVSDRSFAGSLSATTADINADGIPDVITASAENPSNSIEVFLGNPDGTLQRPALYPVPSVVSFLAFADLNGDGRIDGVIASPSGVVILNGTRAPFLRLKVAHTGNFYLRQDADFTVQVSNVANASATNGSVKVTDFPIPAPYSILQSLSGDGWTCDLSSCSRSDPLQPGESYPPIAVVVLFFDPVTLATNLASVSGTNLPITDATDADTVLPYTTQCLLSLEGAQHDG